MKQILYFIILAAAFSACSSRHPEEQAAKAAKQYYDLLLRGKYEAFVDARQDSQGASAEYRSQLVDNMRMFAAQMEKEHQGMRDTPFWPSVLATAPSRRWWFPWWSTMGSGA